MRCVESVTAGRPLHAPLARRWLARVVATLAVLGSRTVARAEPDTSTPPYFYQPVSYGNQALYGPLYVLLNRGFDVLQLREDNRSILTQPYAHDGRNVLDNLAHPFSRIADEGWGRFLREEIFPLSYSQDNARWVPNYALHLIGGGMTYAQLREWFIAHGAPAPWLLSTATLLTTALINETIENKGVVGTNTDAIADFYFFDIGGILLFSFDGVKRFFSRTVLLADWSLQPSFTYPYFGLHNQGNNYAFKFPVPFLPRLRLFGHMGLGTMGGLSYLLDDGYSISAAGGVRSTRMTNVSKTSVENVIEFRPSGALFLDRRQSLLASVIVSDVQDYFVHINVYPNAFYWSEPGVGFWTAIERSGRFIVGLSLVQAFGLGVGLGPVP